MKPRYLAVLVAVLAAAVALTLLGRLPRGAAAPQAVEAPVPVVPLALTVAAGAVTPAHASVPKNDDVLLSVHNDGAAAVDFELAGYGDRVRARIEPGATWTTRFRADLPGADFAWMVDGEPAGRFAVAGSHLVEGHR